MNYIYILIILCFFCGCSEKTTNIDFSGYWQFYSKQEDSYVEFYYDAQNQYYIQFSNYSGIRRFKTKLLPIDNSLLYLRKDSSLLFLKGKVFMERNDSISIFIDTATDTLILRKLNIELSKELVSFNIMNTQSTFPFDFYNRRLLFLNKLCIEETSSFDCKNVESITIEEEEFIPPAILSVPKDDLKLKD